MLAGVRSVKPGLRMPRMSVERIEPYPNRPRNAVAATSAVPLLPVSRMVLAWLCGSEVSRSTTSTLVTVPRWMVLCAVSVMPSTAWERRRPRW